MKKKYIPNIISLSRLALCIPLYILPPFTIVYMTIYFIAGTTDVIDGPVARRIKGGASELGATLDSIADVALVCALVFVVMPQMVLWDWLWTTYVCILSLKICMSVIVGLIKFKELIFLHTLSFKALVFILFCYPFLYYFIGESLFMNAFSVGLLSFGVLVVVEEIFIILMTKKPERNLKSIFGVKAANLAAEEALAQK